QDAATDAPPQPRVPSQRQTPALDLPAVPPTGAAVAFIDQPESPQDTVSFVDWMDYALHVATVKADGGADTEDALLARQVVGLPEGLCTASALTGHLRSLPSEFEQQQFLFPEDNLDWVSMYMKVLTAAVQVKQWLRMETGLGSHTLKDVMEAAKGVDEAFWRNALPGLRSLLTALFQTMKNSA
ncbi:hypothetical protein M422DRAFT_245516, partial [Sphaerobolus stellatus SS14]